MFSSGLFPLIDKPTRISTTATLLDNIWTNNYTHPSKNAIFTDPISDHFAVFQCTALPISPYRITNTEKVRIFNENNLRRFHDILDEHSWDDVYAQNDPDPAFRLFLHKLQFTFNETFPIISRTILKSKING